MSTEQSATESRKLATRIVLSYPSDLGQHGRRRIEADHFKKWLRRTREEAVEGDLWEEFTDVGCCGSHMDVPLRVERVEGGSVVDFDTVIAYEEREACGLNPGWSVQHDEPPRS